MAWQLDRPTILQQHDHATQGNPDPEMVCSGFARSDRGSSPTRTQLKIGGELLPNIIGCVLGDCSPLFRFRVYDTLKWCRIVKADSHFPVLAIYPIRRVSRESHDSPGKGLGLMQEHNRRWPQWVGHERLLASGLGCLNNLSCASSRSLLAFCCYGTQLGRGKATFP